MSKAPGSRDNIIIRGARVNNLKNIDVEIPRNQLVVITGLSGSGKSSLAFDLVYAEGNRRYLESLSSYARQFLDVSAKPDVDKVENLSPTISIDQRSLSRSPRSTVGTLTEIYDYLRVLFAKVGIPYCPRCQTSMERVPSDEIYEEILKLEENSQIAILAPTSSDKKELPEILKSVRQLGYARVRIGGKIKLIDEIEREDESGSVEVVVDRMMLKKKSIDRERIFDSLETAFKLGHGSLIITIDNEKELAYNKDFACAKCGFRIEEITPKHFSFNSPEGACMTCSGLGIVHEIEEELLIPNKNLTLAEGAIMPLSKLGGRSASINGNMSAIRELAIRYRFSIDVPVKKLSREHMEIILHGDRDRNGSFPGIVTLLKKKMEESNGYGGKNEIEKYMVAKICPKCLGKRLKDEFLSVLVGGQSIADVVNMDIDKFIEYLKSLSTLETRLAEKSITAPLVKEMTLKAIALKNVGLEYLSLSRGANTISGGEGQRIRLATQIGSELSGIIYVLDEPSIGLHNRDTEKLITTIKEIKEVGNSMIVVEHDEEIIKKADWIIDMGPGAGEDGGQVIFSGTPKKMLSGKSLTAQYINGQKKTTNKKKIRKGNGKHIEVLGATDHNLKDLDIKIPLGKFVAISGVSGSGKSTLMTDILSKALGKHFYNTKDMPGAHRAIKGMAEIDKYISINQSPIGRTPRSNAATYTGVFSLIRELFAGTAEAEKRGYGASRFSFNMKGGRCEDCQGDGTKKIEMHLLPDMYVKCETCSGTRYNQKTLDIEYQGVNIAQVLDMSVSYALKFFSKSQLIVEKLRTLEEVGLGYLKLGQSATNLSGGEAQRIKLATELSRKSTGKTLYILDEPTIGLHFEDVKKLLGVLDALVDRGNTVLVIEHNPDVIRNADWVIDLGPEGGHKGGNLVYEGTPEGLKKCRGSWTGKYL